MGSKFNEQLDLSAYQQRLYDSIIAIINVYPFKTDSREFIINLLDELVESLLSSDS